MKSFGKLTCLNDEQGQILPWMAPLMIVFLGFAGLTIDLGRGWVAYRELQTSADAAALAGVSVMTGSTATASSVQSAVCGYSSNTSTTNNCTMITTGTSGTTTTTTKSGINPAHGINSATTTATLSCVTGEAYVVVPCTGSTTGYNVLQVVERASIPTYLIRALGAFGINAASSLTMNATSSATLSGSMAPLDVAILLDTTASMGGNDPNCGTPTKTQEQCALNGLQALLEELPQCAEVDPATGICMAYNQVSLFTFPNVQANTVSADTTCTGSGKPTIVNYSWPTAPTSSTTTWTDPTGSSATYQITGFSDGYAGSSKGSLSTSSPIVIATGGTGSSKCTGLQTPGGVETYYAGAINAAQSALMAASNGTTSKMVMIILSDGAANSSHIASPGSSGYGSQTDECQQAIAAAQNATSLGTTVYTVAYNSATTGCTTDSSNYSSKINLSGLSPCTTMKYMSSNWPTNTSHFFSDGGSATACGVAGGGPSDLPQIFTQIETAFTSGRLIPNS
jgi:hypothetical protein